MPRQEAPKNRRFSDIEFVDTDFVARPVILRMALIADTKHPLRDVHVRVWVTWGMSNVRFKCAADQICEGRKCILKPPVSAKCVF